MKHATVLCVNSGSSSLKVALFEVDGQAERRLADAHISDVKSFGDALAQAMKKLEAFPKPTMAGHRVVHGGPRHVAPAKVDAALLADLEKLVPLAPLHLPAAIAGMKAISEIPQVACFDTAFHATLPDVARRFAIPDRFEEVRRYGFHGLSYEYVVSTLHPLPEKVVIAHLGNGASLCAVKNGKSVDTTMGLTPTGGIPMSTRSGDLDPSVIGYLLRKGKMTEKAISEMLDHESGLIAICGTSDMKEILKRRMAADARADLAFRVFTNAVRKAIGSFAAVLGGVDLVVFTGGIGENAPEVRDETMRGLEFLRTEVRVVGTDEDRMVARHTYATLSGARV